MTWLDSFTALIQLISAVNFVYIVSHFPTKVLSVIFNKEKLIADHFSSSTNQINADLQSLETMNPITIQDGRTNQAEIDSLKDKYTSLKNDWDAKQAETERVIDTAKSVKGSKCLFLFISLYCILTLFNIGIMKACQTEFWCIETMTFNVIALGCSLYYTYIMWKHKWDGKGDVECYTSTGWWFLAVLVAAYLLSGLNSLILSWVGGIPLHQPSVDVLLSLCVILPFYPCLMTIVFIYCHERKIKNLTGKETSDLKVRQADLHARKVALDNMDRMFTPPGFGR